MDDSARVLLYTGDGKGKTTAALGLCMRALGRGLRVSFVQFVKDRNLQTGEAIFLERMDALEFIRCGLGRVPPPATDAFKRHVRSAAEGLERALGALQSGRCDLLVLDEVCVAITKELLAVQPVCHLIRSAWPGQTVVMTGRNAPAALIERSDTVTEMHCVKHAFQTGRTARKGVEM